MSEYKKAGVDLDKLREYHDIIKSKITSIYSKTILGAGHYAGVLELGGIKLALHVDGVGTKTELALKTGIVKPIGIDCVAMNVNDLLCVGATPIAILDYIALEKPMDYVIREIIDGLMEGARESNVEIVGGETAIMPGVIKGFDIACTGIGIVKELKVGDQVKPGDIVLGLESNGVHANGFSLIRRLISEGRLDLESWKDELLKPTKIYVKVLEVIDKIKGLAHITGGSFLKIKRITNYKVVLNLPEPPEIFKAIENAGVSHEEMHRVFNMGIGMVVFVSPNLEKEVIKVLSNYFNVYKLGIVEDGSGIIIKSYKNLILRL
ncbi:MAG: phosphoribosylformylglycinamidine cyclo-ligase [Sulfolobaceae archaeon]